MVYDTPTVALQPKLTRACKACIKAKRKCSLDLPKCVRCQKRQSECDYANQPLTARQTDTAQKRHVEGELNITPRASPGALDPNLSLTCIRLQDPIAALTVDRRTLSFLNSHLQKEVTSFSQTGTNSFIHAKTPPSALLADVRRLVAMLGSHATLDHTSHLDTIPRDYVYLLDYTLITLISAVPTLHNYTSLLPFTQSLILIQILTLFVIPTHLLPPWIQQTSQARRQLLKRTMRQLWQAAPAYMPSTMSKHEAYALAESTRRTIIMALELEAQCSIYDRGFYNISLLNISFPFDRRFSLWGVEPVAFDEAMEKLGDGQGAQHMVSYREFCDMFDRREIQLVEGLFEVMVLVGAKGLDKVEERYGIGLT